MFESVKQDGGKSGLVYLASLLVSLAAHAVIICLLIVVPLIFFNVLQAQDLLTFLIEPPAPPTQPPPVPPVKGAASVRHAQMTAMYEAPRAIPEGIPPAADADFEPLNPGSVITAIAGAGDAGLPGGMGKGIADLFKDPMIAPAPPKPPEKPRTPVRVGALEQSKLIYKVNPVYPAVAVKAHIQGIVVLEAVVDEEGIVSTLKVLSGHPFLVDAAVQAVKQWKYSPTVLNGEPVPVVATVTVVFRLN